MATVSLSDYQRAEREISIREARIGMWVHATVTVLVWGIVIAVNVVWAPEFPWSIFPVVGMAIGLFLHWWFGYRHLEEMIQRHQADIERRALTHPVH
ncbi:MAG TPA: 2TM domain-containing protein [Jiangellaceae bacterium]|nr:2TM domain-containing protein [Jiangellaceae bacterium]